MFSCCRTTVALAMAAVAAAAVAACGASRGGGDHRPAAPGAPGAPAISRPARASAAPHRSALGPPPSLDPGHLLVFFKRMVGADPLASQLTVDRDGRAAALITLGGEGGEARHDFRLTGAALRRLTRLVQTTTLRDTGCCDVNHYIYFISAGGHSWRLEQRQIPARSRALLRELGAITDAHTSYQARTTSAPG